MKVNLAYFSTLSTKKYPASRGLEKRLSIYLVSWDLIICIHLKYESKMIFME
jgi:hypothetical protein